MNAVATPIPAPVVPTVGKDDIAYASYAKIKRAYDHFLSLHQRFIDFAKTDFCSITVERNPESGHPFLRADVKPLPDEVSLIVGDVAHNLRIALDILWNTMCRRLGGEESYFPIRERREEFEGSLKADMAVTPSVPAVDQILLDRTKLYKIGIPPGNPAVWYLNRLDRPDKHSTLVATDIDGRVSVRYIAVSSDLATTISA